jgi:hypothetical protein
MFHNYHKSAELSASKWLISVWELAVQAPFRYWVCERRQPRPLADQCEFRKDKIRHLGI